MTAAQFFSVVEIRTKVISLSTFLLASVYVRVQTGQLDPLRTLLMLIATLLVDMGTTGFNTFFDYWRGVDYAAQNTPIIHQGVPWGWVLLTSAALFILAVPFGIALALLSGWPVILIGMACMAIGYFYTGGPYPISRTPLGEVFAGGALGSGLFLLIWYIHAGVPNRAVVGASLPSTFLIASILTVNNTCDLAGDAKAGRRTLSVLLGPAGGEILGIFEAATGFGLLVVMRLGRMEPMHRILIPFLMLLAALEFILMHRRAYKLNTKESSMKSITKVFLYFTVAAVVSLL